MYTVAMGNRRPFRTACGPTCEKDERGIVLIDHHIRTLVIVSVEGDEIVFERENLGTVDFLAIQPFKSAIVTKDEPGFRRGQLRRTSQRRSTSRSAPRRLLRC